MARAWAEIDLGAIRHNVRTLRAVAAPARFCAVVKANGYGHGAAAVGTRRARGRAPTGWAWPRSTRPWRCATPASRPRSCCCPSPGLDEVDDASPPGARLTVYSPDGRRPPSPEVRAAPGGRRRRAVHLKVDTGMHRVGAAPSRHGRPLARAIGDLAEVELEGVCTHLPVADEPDNPYTDDQLARFDAVLAELRAAGIDPGIVHAANSAGLARPPRGPLRPGAVRHRGVRHPAGPGAGGGWPTCGRR